MSYATIPVDQEFAQRSARYLAARGCTTSEICLALVEELELDRSSADHIVEHLAA